MLTRYQLNKIKEFSINIDWNIAFDGRARGNLHLFRVVKIAKELANNQNVDLNIVEAGAWLHDTNLEVTVSGSTLANINKINTFLNSIGVSRKDIKEINNCIASHDGRKKAKTLESKIIHDADTLDKTGALGILRETWKKSQSGWNTEKIATHLQNHLKKRKNNLFLSESKKLADYNNKKLKEFFKMLNNQIKI